MDENTQRETRRIQRARERAGQTLVAISDQHAERLRAFAADLGLYTSRGPRIGNIHALFTLLAQAIESNPDAVRSLLDAAAAPDVDALAA